MCGIAGFIGNFETHEEINPGKVLQAMNHRGPDGKGFSWYPGKFGKVFLAHTRLSIIDTSSSGAQPMVAGHAGKPPHVAITFNGEIYNYRELRKDLSDQGVEFHGKSDTEVILQSYIVWGIDCFSRLRGMFAFGLVDSLKEKVFLVRDHLGIKPIYFNSITDKGLSFASETRMFRVLPGHESAGKINRDSLHGFLAMGMVLGNRTFVQGVEELEPGHAIEAKFTGEILNNKPYLPSRNSVSIGSWDRKNAVNLIRESLNRSVERHLVSDVPVGIFLSSGIDSSALAAIASKNHPNLRTISIGFNSKNADESKEASLIANDLGLPNETFTLTDSALIGEFERVLDAIDQPTIDGFNSYIVSKVARSAGLKVALSGLGGDEVFGGYATFRDVPNALRLSKITRLFGIGTGMKALGKVFCSRALWKAGRTGSTLSTLAGMYFLRRELYAPIDRLEILGPSSSYIEPNTGVPFDLLDSLVSERNVTDLENSVGFIEQQVYMRNMLLRDSDVFSMANSLEIRVPLLDQDLVEIVNPMPGEWKRPGTRSKDLLVEAVGPRFPRRILGKKKRGFTFPWKAWIQGSLRSFVMERLNSSNWKDLGIKNLAIENIWLRFINGDPSVSALHVLALVILGDLIARQKISL